MEEAKTEVEVLPGGMTRANLNVLKQTHGTVYSITVKDDEGNPHSAWFKKPDMDVMAMASQHIDTDPFKAGKVMYNSCKIGGDASIDADDELKMSVIAKLGDLFKIREAILKKW